MPYQHVCDFAMYVLRLALRQTQGMGWNMVRARVRIKVMVSFGLWVCIGMLYCNSRPPVPEDPKYSTGSR